MRLAERFYQREAIHGGRGHPGIYKALRVGRTTLLVLPTGCGKTIVFARVVEACLSRGKRALVLAHREELIQGAYEKLIGATSVDALDVGVEMAGSRAGDHHRAVLASVQTLKGARLARFRPEEFGLVVVDEAHHAVAKGYRRILDHFGQSKVLGVSATPERLDGVGLGKVFGSVAYVYELADAIRDGFLVRILAEEVSAGDAIDLSQVRTTAGDLNLGDLADVMERQPALALVARGTVDLAGDRETMVFCATVDQAHATAAMIDSYTGRPGCARAIDGTASPEERREFKRAFEAGEFQYALNCALYTEGVDIPRIRCVAIARPTKSASLYAQMIGRGTRLLGATMEESVAAGKEDLLVLDFAGRVGRHRLASAVDVLAGTRDEAIRKRAHAAVTGRRMDALAAIDAAEAEEARREALAAVQYRSHRVDDPLTVLGVRLRPRGHRPAGVDQLERLERNGIPGASEQLAATRAAEAAGAAYAMRSGDYDALQASQILNAIGKRRRAGKCSLRMSAVLRKAGLNDDVSFDTAKWAIGILKENRWSAPPELHQHPELARLTNAGATR